MGARGQSKIMGPTQGPILKSPRAYSAASKSRAQSVNNHVRSFC